MSGGVGATASAPPFFAIGSKNYSTMTNQQTLEIQAYKLPTGDWAFDHPHQDTVCELLCNGTELVLDRYFQDLTLIDPAVGSKLSVSIQLQPFANRAVTSRTIETRLHKLGGDDLGTLYKDSKTQMEAWLCPWLQGYFGFVPDVLYVAVCTD